MLPACLGTVIDDEGYGALVESSCTCSLVGTPSSGLSLNRRAMLSSPLTLSKELIYMRHRFGPSFGSWPVLERLPRSWVAHLVARLQG